MWCAVLYSTLLLYPPLPYPTQTTATTINAALNRTTTATTITAITTTTTVPPSIPCYLLRSIFYLSFSLYSLSLSLSLSPEPATEHDCSGSSSITPVEDGGIFLIQAWGFRTSSSPTPGVGSGGLVPRIESAVLGGLPFTSSIVAIFAHTSHV